MTSRELVRKTLEFDSPPRIPRQLWVLPWAKNHYPQELENIRQAYPDDLTSAPASLTEPPRETGNAYTKGFYTDPWGCVFENRQDGVIGEVKAPILKAEDWSDQEQIRFPREWLSVDTDAVNRFCRSSDLFILGGCCPRPFERLQFLRGTEQLYIDLMLKPGGFMIFLKKLQNFYIELMELWSETEVDALMFMDDWGAQNSLLINPQIWREIFKPLYRTYAEIAHGKGKKLFMHSDGNILEIYPDLVEIGVDAVNSQLFCMGTDKLKPFAGKITFWGEIDRQHLLPYGTRTEIETAVDSVYNNLWDRGGCIAQCEFGIGARPENVESMYRRWNKYPV